MEKDQYAHREVMDGMPKSPTSSQEFDSTFSEAQYRKIVHRIDMRLVTVVGVCPQFSVLQTFGARLTSPIKLMYCVSLMDRTNLAVALVAEYVHRIILRLPLTEH